MVALALFAPAVAVVAATAVALRRWRGAPGAWRVAAAVPVLILALDVVWLLWR